MTSRRVGEGDQHGSGDGVVGFLKATKMIVSSLASIGAEYGLTADDVLVLDAIASCGGQSMAALAERTPATGATLTRSVDRLVSNALVYREAAAGDRRRIEVHLAEQGGVVHRRLVPRLAELDQDVAGMLEALQGACVVNTQAQRAAGSASVV